MTTEYKFAQTQVVLLQQFIMPVREHMYTSATNFRLRVVGLGACEIVERFNGFVNFTYSVNMLRRITNATVNDTVLIQINGASAEYINILCGTAEIGFIDRICTNVWDFLAGGVQIQPVVVKHRIAPKHVEMNIDMDSTPFIG
jgi:hypothetical protein